MAPRIAVALARRNEALGVRALPALRSLAKTTESPEYKQRLEIVSERIAKKLPTRAELDFVISVFAHKTEDSKRVLQALKKHQPESPWRRAAASLSTLPE